MTAREVTDREASNKELVRNYLRAFNDRDWETLSELLADDVRQHGAHGEVEGYDELVEFFDAHFSTFPDYTGTTEAILADADTVAVRYMVEGTHTGEYKDLEPTGHSVEWTGLAMYRIENGEIAEIWIEEDRMGLFEQLEVVDPPAHLRI